ncbi:hypothetical protein GCM10022236_23790 [Microlunatus ginsengisoli]|uniref:Uncharacterized protein n=1 Tax=Microlunatus ginsengisoli TaxID=363863 RepID=A0ABP6ZYJ6_9ACTN
MDGLIQLICAMSRRSQLLRERRHTRMSRRRLGFKLLEGNANRVVIGHIHQYASQVATTQPHPTQRVSHVHGT